MRSGIDAGLKNPREPLPVTQKATDEDYRTVQSWINAYRFKGTMPAHRSPAQGVTLVPFSQIRMKAIQWLWRGYLPKGKMILFAGPGGVGKSTVACNFAGIVSTGASWPDGSRCEVAGNVLIWSSEDDPHDTLAPRLWAAGANLERCHFIQGPKDENGVGRSFDPATDMDQLRKTVTAINGVSLLIIDPLVNAVKGDMNKANDVRRSLQPIVDFASETNCAVLGISHFGKNTQGRNSAERILGSTAFKDFARTALVAVQHPETGDCAFARAKTNLAANTGGFSYRMEQLHLQLDHEHAEVCRVVWREALEGSARAILARFEDGDKEDGAKLSTAKQFLLTSLAHGAVSSKELLDHAREEYNISNNTLRQAKDELGVKAEKLGYGGSWMWSMPFANQTR